MLQLQLSLVVTSGYEIWHLPQEVRKILRIPHLALLYLGFELISLTETIILFLFLIVSQ